MKLNFLGNFLPHYLSAPEPKLFSYTVKIMFLFSWEEFFLGYPLQQNSSF